tara:strand:- start:4446 stop:5327 length:882 start_codon:yes stop_codon:yes gene_type:complete
VQSKFQSKLNLVQILRYIDFQKKLFNTLSANYSLSECTRIFFSLLEEIESTPKYKVVLNWEGEVAFEQKLLSHLASLKQGFPLQYVLGSTWFYGIKILLNKNVLIPRPETEELVQKVLQKIKNIEQNQVLDIGTGSGCIAVAIKKSMPLLKVFALDVSEKAIKLARQNARSNGVNINCIKLDILDVDAWKRIPEKINIIVSNPPYIANPKEIDNKVFLNEPHLALLTPPNDPFIFYRKIVELAKNKKTVRKIFFEIHENYSEELVRKDFMLRLKKEVVKDLQGKDRFLFISLD